MKLTFEQERAIGRGLGNTLLVKGSAGSGKSLVAINRAIKIAQDKDLMNTRKNVFVFTFNKTLVEYLRNIMKHYMNIFHPRVFGNIQINNFHKWAFHYIRNNLIRGFKPTILNDKERKRYLWQILNSKSRIPSGIDVDFLLEEIDFTKENLLTEEEFFNSKFNSRSRNFVYSKEKKEFVWDVYRDYLEVQTRKGFTDFSDFSRIIWEKIQGKKTNNLNTFIIIDEVQDFSRVQLLVLSKLFSPRITLVGDIAQRIYRTGYNWKSANLYVRGRVETLTQNFRNPSSIYDIARKLIENDEQSDEYTISNPVKLSNELPKHIVAGNLSHQVDCLINELTSIDLEQKTVVILHRTNKGVDEIIKMMNDKGMPTFNLHKVAENNQKIFDEDMTGKIPVCTLHSIKGLEFDYVFILDLDQDICSYFSSETYKSDEESIAIENRLLYTAMTRVKDSLFFLSNSHYPKILDELGLIKISKVA